MSVGVFAKPGGSRQTNARAAVAAAADGSVYVGGDFDNAGAIPANYVARWDGVAWYPLGTGLDAPPEQIAVSGKNVYVVGDNITRAGDAVVNDIARWNGTQWT